MQTGIASQGREYGKMRTIELYSRNGKETDPMDEKERLKNHMTPDELIELGMYYEKLENASDFMAYKDLRQKILDIYKTVAIRWKELDDAKKEQSATADIGK